MPARLNEADYVIGDLLQTRARAQPDAPFCHVSGTGFTFTAMDARADEVAAGFSAHGVRAGDRVATLTPNRVEVLEMFFGLARLGAIQVPLNAFLKGAFLQHQLALSRASVLVADAAGIAAALPLLDELTDLRLIVLLDPGDTPAPTRATQTWSFADVTAPGQGEPPACSLTASDTMSIISTSGTTGLPKGCTLSNGYYARSAWMMGLGLDISETDVVYSPLPLFHAGGSLMVLTMALVAGIAVHFDRDFSARAFIPRAAEADATVVVVVGAMAMALLATPETPADHAHGIHSMFAAPLTPEDQTRIQERFGIQTWTEAYGQTECTPLCLAPRNGPRDPAGCGFAAPDLEVKLLDDELREVPIGDVGELCIRPKARWTMFDGYWDDPEATLNAFRGLWYHTGDAAKQLASGQFTFVDRKKDALRRRGENVSSIELEIAIRLHAKIADAAIHAVPSSVGEDDIKACLVLLPGEALAPAEAFAFFAENLPYYAMPRYVEICDTLPRTATGRVMKHLLRDNPLNDQTWDFDALGFQLAREQRRASVQAST